MKVFLTVGSMLPFDRLVRTVDLWAKDYPDTLIYGQIGETSLRPVNIEFSAMVSPAEYRRRFAECDLVVSHVGMGTVITAFELNKPLVMLPRRADLQEVTSNHQIATAEWLEGRPGIHIVHSEHELAAAISRNLDSEGVSRIETGTRERLIEAIRLFIAQ
jgi:UDP-N-acetylglucosamine transferase subunit ALG13